MQKYRCVFVVCVCVLVSVYERECVHVCKCVLLRSMVSDVDAPGWLGECAGSREREEEMEEVSLCSPRKELCPVQRQQGLHNSNTHHTSLYLSICLSIYLYRAI